MATFSLKQQAGLLDFFFLAGADCTVCESFSLVGLGSGKDVGAEVARAIDLGVGKRRRSDDRPAYGASDGCQSPVFVLPRQWVPVTEGR